MIAVSSFRPKAKCAPDIWQNQVNARKSWDAVFEKVVYLGTTDPELTGRVETLFEPAEDFPRIADMAKAASQANSWACIINADIWLKPEFAEVERKLHAKAAHAAVSSRRDLNTNEVVDAGLDIFMAIAPLWASIAQDIPKDFRIGHIHWDTWVIGWFNAHCGRKSFWDISPLRLVYHPRHEDRIRPHSVPKLAEVWPLGMPRNVLPK